MYFGKSQKISIILKKKTKEKHGYHIENSESDKCKISYIRILEISHLEGGLQKSCQRN